MVFKVTEEFYNKEVEDLKNDILTGKTQREFKGRKGVVGVSMTFKDINK